MKQRMMMLLKGNGRFPLLILLFTLLLTLAFCRTRQTPCPPATAGPDGYLAAICHYARDHDIDVSPGDPARYEIVRTEMSERDGRSVILVLLNCCYLGDVATVDAATGEVIDFRLGVK